VDDRRKPTADADGQTQSARSYEPPVVEDLDSSYGPSVTAAGKTIVTASPRKL
jgi:hypothetical protein